MVNWKALFTPLPPPSFIPYENAIQTTSIILVILFFLRLLLHPQFHGWKIVSKLKFNLPPALNGNQTEDNMQCGTIFEIYTYATWVHRELMS